MTKCRAGFTTAAVKHKNIDSNLLPPMIYQDWQNLHVIETKQRKDKKG